MEVYYTLLPLWGMFEVFHNNELNLKICKFCRTWGHGFGLVFFLLVSFIFF